MMNEENEMMWYRFVEAGGYALAARKLESMVGEADADTIHWAFKRALTYTDYLSEEILADAVAKRAASAMKRRQKETFSLAKDLSGGLCLGVLA
jgi:hypothetical protein